jgi:predicted transcriptional regulator
LEEEVRRNLDRYAEFLNATPSYVVSEALKLLFRKDEEYKRWADAHAATTNDNHESVEGDALKRTA